MSRLNPKEYPDDNDWTIEKLKSLFHIVKEDELRTSIKIDKSSNFAIHRKRYQNLISFLCALYKEDFEHCTLHELIYRCVLDIKYRPKCPICNKEFLEFQSFDRGYKFICHECAKTDAARQLLRAHKEKIFLEKHGVRSIYEIHDKIESIKSKTRSTMLKRFGATSYLGSNEWKERFNAMKESGNLPAQQEDIIKKISASRKANGTTQKECAAKVIETNLKIYGTKSPLQNDNVKAKTKKTNLKKYGNEVYQRTEDFRSKIAETCKEKYGVCNVLKIKEIHDKSFSEESKLKRYAALKRNRTFNTSKIQCEIKEFLFRQFGKDDVIEEHIDKERYSWHCDFYIKSIDVFIEVQCSWTHGKHPYDSANLEDVKRKIVLESKAGGRNYYHNALET